MVIVDRIGAVEFYLIPRGIVRRQVNLSVLAEIAEPGGNMAEDAEIGDSSLHLIGEIGFAQSLFGIQRRFNFRVILELQDILTVLKYVCKITCRFVGKHCRSRRRAQQNAAHQHGNRRYQGHCLFHGFSSLIKMIFRTSATQSQPV